MRHKVHCLLIVLSATGLLLAANPQAPPSKKDQTDAAAFEKSVPPVLAKTCAPCHNDRLASGGLNLGPFSAPGSIAEHRDGWERILQKIRTGEMPPEGIPRPPEDQIDALVKFVEGEFEKADRNVKPDPGRVTARRLNRNEYSNTIRDLLAVDFRAEKDFPTDDSGHGFDNIGDVLTISPVLMEKYIAAAERIAARAIGADPLPKKPVEAEYHIKHKTIRRPRRQHDRSHSPRRIGTASTSCESDFPGSALRMPSRSPWASGWMASCCTRCRWKPSRPSWCISIPTRKRRFASTLPEGDHVFRAGFINDDFVKDCSGEGALQQTRRTSF